VYKKEKHNLQALIYFSYTKYKHITGCAVAPALC